MTDYLILLLSTDWFLPFWSEVGIVATDAMKIGIQQGCRDIVRSFMDGAAEYYDIAFSEKRRRETDSMFGELLERMGANEAISAVVRDWASQSRDVFSTELVLRMLTQDLNSSDSRESGPNLDVSIRFKMEEVKEEYLLDPSQFEQCSTESRSVWDAYVQGLFDDQPSALSDNLAPFVRERRLRRLWSHVSERLTPEERQDLVSWCRAMAKLHGIPGDPLPFYIF